MTAMIEEMLAACSAVLAKAPVTAMTPKAAKMAATMSASTPNGSPQSAPIAGSAVVTTTSTTRLRKPSRNAVIALPRMIEDLEMGAASSRLMVPEWRSSRRLFTPNCTVKNTKKIARPAA